MVAHGILKRLMCAVKPAHQLGGGDNSCCHDLPPPLFKQNTGNEAGYAGGGAPTESPSTAPSSAPDTGSHLDSGRAGSEGECHHLLPSSPSHRITEHEARVVLADLVEAMTRRDRAKTVAAILAARFTDAELEWLSNQLGRVPHERKRK